MQETDKMVIFTSLTGREYSCNLILSAKIENIRKMRKRFEQQLQIGQFPISEIQINPKSHNALEQLVAALKKLYCDKKYNERVFSVLEEMLEGKDRNNGRPGMNLWTIFVLAQVRLCLNCGYDMLHHQANNDYLLRCLLGVERAGFDRIEFEYQQIYDNVSRLSDTMLKDLNDIIVEFGQKEVFKKKGNTALHLKTDSFVVESNVHFPTDYNLLWDCIRKSLDMIGKIEKRHSSYTGWRKRKSWYRDLKSLMRELGRVSKSGGKQKEERLQETARQYLNKSVLLLDKLKQSVNSLPLTDETDMFIIISLEYYMTLMEKHIDLVERRILKGEQIPHEEKMFSIFEPYTEWITKGKLRPSVELGKKLGITSDQWGLIVDYQIMTLQQDRDVVIGLVERLLEKFNITSWSFDKGYWNAENRDLLSLYIKDVVMPKLGRLSGKDAALENSPVFKRLKNKHSAIESNINELEHRGLDRCPDRGESHFKTYISLGICAYNLKKIGCAILKEQCKAKKLCSKAA